MLAISCLANRDFAFSTDLRWGNKVGQYSDRRYEGKKKKKKETSTLRTLDNVFWAWRHAAMGSCPHPTGGKAAVHPQRGSGSSDNKTIPNDASKHPSNVPTCKVFLRIHGGACWCWQHADKQSVSHRSDSQSHWFRVGRLASEPKNHFSSPPTVKTPASLRWKFLSTLRGGKISGRSFLRCTSASRGIKILVVHFL